MDREILEQIIFGLQGVCIYTEIGKLPKFL